MTAAAVQVSPMVNVAGRLKAAIAVQVSQQVSAVTNF